ncbi:hypothetical protein ER308_09500 [Egibacter rhizosphaerae]|uniref:RCK N-terminal domain-containing protein n=1 Tax=Egibacter rhizosphaerae TaxID=1670831 RepID=A0A411YES8_9ACTN|nr:potassium channel family protein [Egibacter rhizosphaerae]QBI19763.1 hypothetical protein ER308_09500 [Egibacter rhizosphaerae]
MSEPTETATEDVRSRPPAREYTPIIRLLRRLLFAASLILFVAIVLYAGRGGYVDEAGGTIGVIDALYYASVTVTTTGYGDIVPVTDGARMATALLVTPARIVFLLLLVGTTVELLTSQWREDLRRSRTRRRLRDHYIVCGYGTKGRAAVEALREDGVADRQVVVIDIDADAAEQARHDGFTVVNGDPARVSCLDEAKVREARGVIIATNRDDTSVLATLTARELNPDARIVAAVREEENAHLLRQGGADAAITTAEASGRLLGLTTRSSLVGRVVDDLLHTAEGFALSEREVGIREVGCAVDATEGQRTLAVVRDGELLRYDDPRLGALREGDRVLGLPDERDGARSRDRQG